MNAIPKILAALAALTVVCTMADRSLAQAPGDYNNDGMLNAADLDLQAVAIKGGAHPPQFDLTRDGLVTFQDRRAWVAGLKRTWIGDANLDLEYNSSDLVQVFAAGKYETGQPAGWGSGDWDGNTVFDSSDLVSAFVDGGYEQGQLLLGDYDRDGQLDADDLDLQAIQMVRGEHPAAYELNWDGLVNFADRQVWVRDYKNTWMGDANLDLEFNTDDLVQVFARGKYETGQTAGWAEGDWNGDTLFSSGDLVCLCGCGDSGYPGPGGCGQGPAPVPEPSGWLLLSLAAGTLLMERRRH